MDFDQFIKTFRERQAELANQQTQYRNDAARYQSERERNANMATQSRKRGSRRPGFQGETYNNKLGS